MSSPATVIPITNKAPPSASLSLLWFFILTTVYCFVKMNTTNPTDRKIYTGVYLLLLIIGQFFLNLNLTETMCGVRQWQTALSVTCIPWFLIFGVLNLFLYLFPDWLTPFSNTFGYFFAKIMGVSDFLDTILRDKFSENAKLDGNTKVMAEALDHIYSDKSLLINEIKDADKDVDSFFQKMGGLFKPGVQNNINNVDKLKYFVNVKHAVAEYVWYMLAGALVTSITYNYVVNLSCSQSIEDMEARRKKYQNEQRANKAEKDATAKRTERKYVNS